MRVLFNGKEYYFNNNIYYRFRQDTKFKPKQGTIAEYIQDLYNNYCEYAFNEGYEGFEA